MGPAATTAPAGTGANVGALGADGPSASSTTASAAKAASSSTAAGTAKSSSGRARPAQSRAWYRLAGKLGRTADKSPGRSNNS
eukprot:10861120-Alexandrium_andersonii.AAC.1